MSAVSIVFLDRAFSQTGDCTRRKKSAPEHTHTHTHLYLESLESLQSNHIPLQLPISPQRDICSSDGCEMLILSHRVAVADWHAHQQPLFGNAESIAMTVAREEKLPFTSSWLPMVVVASAIGPPTYPRPTTSNLRDTPPAEPLLTELARSSTSAIC